MRSTITERGQTVIPAAIRRQFHLNPADRLEWVLENGAIRVVPVRANPVDAFRGQGKGGATGRPSACRSPQGAGKRMKRYALDTSALLTLRDDEPGAERVAEVLYLAAELKALYPLLLADAWIAACARVHSAVLVHKAPEFKVLPIAQEPLPLKVKKGKA